MFYIFRFIGLLVGFRLARFPGAFVGFIVGASLDFFVSSRLANRKSRRVAQKMAQHTAAEVFFQSIFSMLGKLAAVDAPPNAQELKAFENICDTVFSLDRKRKQYAHEIFDSSRSSATTFQFHAAQLHAYYQQHQAMLENMLDLLVSFSLADGVLNPAEESLLRSAGTIFGFSDNLYNDILARRGAARSQTQGHKGETLADHYSVLGCKPTDTEADIKKRYRKLVADFHPDKILSKELPPEFIEFAHKKFRDIQHAYESVKKQRGFS